MQMQLIFHPLFEYFTDFMKNIPCPKINEWMILGMCLYQGIWVLGLFTRSPAELLSCLTGTGTNSLNHGRIRDRADFSFLSRAASVGVTDTTNEFKPMFSVCSRLSYPTRSRHPPLKLTPVFCVSDCVSVLVTEPVNVALLRGRADMDPELSSVCKWPFISVFPVVWGAHSNSPCTSLNCWINSNEQFNMKKISCGINKHFKSVNCKSSQLKICIFLS